MNSGPRAAQPWGARVLLAAGTLVLAAVPATWARVYATQQEALARLLPPPATIERHIAYLTEEQARRVEELSGESLQGHVVPYYVGRVEEKVIGYAFTDSHLVRTLPESVLFALDDAGRIRSTEILSFDEPSEYLPSPRWLKQFEQQALDDRLSLKQDIRTLTGATISSRVVTEAARRVLALFQVIIREGESGSAPAPVGEGSR
ncbi:MAG: FMN-binding protein [Acidobacteria bacterium]|nr:FMN-binding protein [Acidobacteriota bacterium]